MPYLLNVLYALILLASSPWLVYKAATTGKYRRGIWRKFWGRTLVRDGEAPCVWFHGVSVGEIHLLQQVVAAFRSRHPGWDCVISTTTDTGFEEARKRFATCPVFYWSLDFSWAVKSALLQVKPSLVVLAEGELWPNFLHAAQERGVPVAVINGRMSPRSFHNYSRFRKLAGIVLSRITCFAVQTEEYASYLRALGMAPQRIHVTGSVKYDGVAMERTNPRTREMGRLLNVQSGDLIWIAGSTQAPEEKIALQVFTRAKRKHSGLRLIIVPRQKDRFDEVGALLEASGQPFVRRSELIEPITNRSAIILMDTIGELGALWGLADIAFVGGSLDGRRGGQNMIEPAAYGAAVLFGPHVWNFRETATRLVDGGAAVQVADAAELEQVIERLLADPSERQRLGHAAQQFVRSQQGATERTIASLEGLLAVGSGHDRAA